MLAFAECSGGVAVRFGVYVDAEGEVVVDLLDTKPLALHLGEHAVGRLHPGGDGGVDVVLGQQRFGVVQQAVEGPVVGVGVIDGVEIDVGDGSVGC